MKRIKSPTGCVHIATDVELNGMHSTLCHHIDYYKSSKEHYYHKWKLTASKVTCKRCLMRLQASKENNFSLSTFSNKKHLLKCGLDEESSLKEAKLKMLWYTKGKKYIKLVDCSTGHLKKFISNENKLNPSIVVIVNNILTDRGHHGL